MFGSRMRTVMMIHLYGQLPVELKGSDQLDKWDEEPYFSGLSPLGPS